MVYFIGVYFHLWELYIFLVVQRCKNHSWAQLWGCIPIDTVGCTVGLHQTSGIEQEKPKRPWFDHGFIAMMVNILEQYFISIQDPLSWVSQSCIQYFRAILRMCLNWTVKGIDSNQGTMSFWRWDSPPKSPNPTWNRQKSGSNCFWAKNHHNDVCRSKHQSRWRILSISAGNQCREFSKLC